MFEAQAEGAEAAAALILFLAVKRLERGLRVIQGCYSPSSQSADCRLINPAEGGRQRGHAVNMWCTERALIAAGMFGR